MMLNEDGEDNDQWEASHDEEDKPLSHRSKEQKPQKENEGTKLNPFLAESNSRDSKEFYQRPDVTSEPEPKGKHQEDVNRPQMSAHFESLKNYKEHKASIGRSGAIHKKTEETGSMGKSNSANAFHLQKEVDEPFETERVPLSREEIPAESSENFLGNQSFKNEENLPSFGKGLDYSQNMEDGNPRLNSEYTEANPLRSVVDQSHNGLEESLSQLQNSRGKKSERVLNSEPSEHDGKMVLYSLMESEKGADTSGDLPIKRKEFELGRFSLQNNTIQEEEIESSIPSYKMASERGSKRGITPDFNQGSSLNGQLFSSQVDPHNDSQENDMRLKNQSSERNVPASDKKEKGPLERQKSKNSEDGHEQEVDIFAQDDDEEELKWKKKLFYKILENWVFSLFVGVITIYSLFSDDFKVLFFEKSADTTFNILNIIAFFTFAFEILAGFFGKPGYKWSFFFWLDIISTVSIVLDITWLAETVLVGGGYFFSLSFSL